MVQIDVLCLLLRTAILVDEDAIVDGFRLVDGDVYVVGGFTAENLSIGYFGFLLFFVVVGVVEGALW